MKAVVLAGGFGQRLLPYTAMLPKPMMPIGKRPILEVIVRQLQRVGVTEILLATGYMDGAIRSYFGDGSQFHIPIRYSREASPLGTAGPLSLVRASLHEPFLVVNGDILTDLDFKHLIDLHNTTGQAATLALAKRIQRVDFGVIRLDPQGKFQEWDEKPTLEYTVSMGIYVMSPRVLDLLPDAVFINLPDFIISLKNAGFQVGAYLHQGYWLDIGRPEDYEQACRDAESLCLL